jgi:hypothetical protein
MQMESDLSEQERLRRVMADRLVEIALRQTPLAIDRLAARRRGWARRHGVVAE